MPATGNPIIRTAIIGYGNLGRSVERIIADQPDMELAAVFSRRAEVGSAAPTLPADAVAEHAADIDVAFICLGSATDVPGRAPELARLVTTVDTYDNHGDLPRHRAAMDAAARETGHLAMVGTGWDPGLFSLNRVLADAILPENSQMTFWGPGLSQGHSDAVRRIDGVIRAVQYTKPNPEAIERVRAGEAAGVDAASAHVRHCYVVADPADHERIREEIATMPGYFAGYETIVDFIDEATFDAEHAGMPHGGRVLTRGRAGDSHHVVEFGLQLERNPDFTAAAQVAYGRAAHRLRAAGEVGARTVLEVPPHLLSATDLDELIAAKL